MEVTTILTRGDVAGRCNFEGIVWRNETFYQTAGEKLYLKTTWRVDVNNSGFTGFKLIGLCAASWDSVGHEVSFRLQRLTVLGLATLLER